MDVLMTGSYGRCGTVIIEHLHGHEEHDWIRFNRSDRPDTHPYGGDETVVGDPTEYDALSSAMEGRDASSISPLTLRGWVVRRRPRSEQR